MRGFKVLLATSAVAISMALVPAVKAQISINIGVQPSCTWGYYDYAPYGCAPSGYYGPGYFYNGIFLGVGPWSNWGYGHGWGGHRFAGGGGGNYRPGYRADGGRNESYHQTNVYHQTTVNHQPQSRPQPQQSHQQAQPRPQQQASHGSEQSHSSGGGAESHGGGSEQHHN